MLQKYLYPSLAAGGSTRQKACNKLIYTGLPVKPFLLLGGAALQPGRGKKILQPGCVAQRRTYSGGSIHYHTRLAQNAQFLFFAVQENDPEKSSLPRRGLQSCSGAGVGTADTRPGDCRYWTGGLQILDPGTADTRPGRRTAIGRGWRQCSAARLSSSEVTAAHPGPEPRPVGASSHAGHQQHLATPVGVKLAHISH